MSFIKQLRIFLFFFFAIVPVTYAMEFQTLSINEKHPHINPTYTHQIFDFSEKIKAVPSMRMIISPESENTILIAKDNGIVSRFSLNKNWEEEQLIKHDLMAHKSMFVAADNKKSLVIASVSSYMNSANKEESECCIWKNGSVKTKYFESLLSAIALNREGNLLITADHAQTKTISIFDLDTDKVWVQHIFSPDKSDRIIDVTCDLRDRFFVIAKTSGITVMGRDGDKLDLYNKNISYINDIKRICFSSYEDITYVTQDNKVKQVNIFGAMNDKVIPTTLCENFLHNQVVIDEEGSESVAFWINDKKNSHIMVQKGKQHNKEEFVLNGALFDENFAYVQVVIRGDNVAAIGSNGMLYWWKIVPHIIQTIFEVAEENAVEVLPRKKSSSRVILDRMKPGSRSRSNSGNKKSNGVPSLFTTSDEDQLLSKQASSSDQKSPKVSPRPTDMLPNKSSRSTDVSPNKLPRQALSSPQILSDKQSIKHTVEDKLYHSSPEIVFNKTSSRKDDKI